MQQVGSLRLPTCCYVHSAGLRPAECTVSGRGFAPPTYMPSGASPRWAYVHKQVGLRPTCLCIHVLAALRAASTCTYGHLWAEGPQVPVYMPLCPEGAQGHVRTHMLRSSMCVYTRAARRAARVYVCPCSPKGCTGIYTRGPRRGPRVYVRKWAPKGPTCVYIRPMAVCTQIRARKGIADEITHTRKGIAESNH